MPDIRRATVKQLAYKIKGTGKASPRFAFFLGAGASRQSGIITASEMIRYFKQQIIETDCLKPLKTDADKEKWLAEQEWYQGESSEYSKLFEHYEPKEMGRQRYVESIIEGRKPSFGYVALANLMASNHINTIITTNFDDLIYSACTTYTDIRPIVFAYGILASEMRVAIPRPKILKLHGDYLYSALKNTDPEVATQDRNMARQVLQVLNEFGLIVVGYAGNDRSIMDILSQISEKNDLYWCVRRGEELNEVVKKLLNEKSGFVIEIEGFDEMMNDIRSIVGFDVRAMLGSMQKRQDEMIEGLKNFAPNYSVEILERIPEALQIQVAQQETHLRKTQLVDFFAKARAAEDGGEHGKAIVLYRRIVELDPSDATAYIGLGDALNHMKRYSEAETAYRKAIELKPNLAKAYRKLGSVLFEDLNRTTEAESAYRKAIELDPSNADDYMKLGNLLCTNLTRTPDAEAAYRMYIDLAPDDASAYVRLGDLLAKDEVRTADSAAAYHQAIEIDPGNNSSYRQLGELYEKSKRYQDAENVYRKAIQHNPRSYSSSCYFPLVMLLRQQGRENEALPLARDWNDILSMGVNPLLSLAAIQ